MASAERLRMRTKLAFGVGGAAEAGTYIAFNSFNMLFYNNVLGLSGTLCGLAVTLALVFDAIADPIIGFWSDRLRSRWGRRHPFLFAAPLPLALSFYLLYSPPEGLTEIPLFLWFTFFTLIFRQALSLYHVPHLALGAELTKDYHERTVVMSYNAIFQVVGGAGAFYAGFTLFSRIPGGSSAREGYPLLGAMVGVLAALIVFSSAYGTRDQIPRLVQAPENPGKANFKAFYAAIFNCLGNRNYRVLLVGLLFLSATVGIRETLASYMGLFFWELPETKMRNFALSSPPAYIVAFVLTVRLHRRFEKRATIIGALLLVIFAAATPLFGRLLGVMPENGAPHLLGVLMLFHFVFYCGFAVLTISVMSALADVADEHELATGARQEGMFYAARTFFGQLSSALGHLIAGVALDLIAFPTGAKPGAVAQEILTALAWVEGPLATVPAFVAIAFYARFQIGKQRLAEIQRELSERHQQAPTPDSIKPPAPVPGEAFASGA